MALIAEGVINITGGFQTNLVSVNKRNTFLVLSKIFILNQNNTSGVIIQVGPGNIYQHNYTIAGALESSGMQFDNFFPDQADEQARNLIGPQSPVYLCTQAFNPQVASFLYQLYGVYVHV